MPSSASTARNRGIGFDRTERAVLAAAGALFDRQGFSQTSLQDVAESVGMARSSLYHYFENREQILAAGIDELTEARDELIREIEAMEPDPRARLDRLMTGLGALIRSHPVWVRVLLRDETALPARTRRRDRASRLAYFELLADTLRRGTEAGVFRARDENATALTIVAALTGLQGEYAAATRTSVGDATQLIVDVLLRGILREEARSGDPIEQGLDLIAEGSALIRRAAARENEIASAGARFPAVPSTGERR